MNFSKITEADKKRYPDAHVGFRQPFRISSGFGMPLKMLPN
jgi:hypothetical protein